MIVSTSFHVLYQEIISKSTSVKRGSFLYPKSRVETCAYTSICHFLEMKDPAGPPTLLSDRSSLAGFVSELGSDGLRDLGLDAQGLQAEDGLGQAGPDPHILG